MEDELKIYTSQYMTWDILKHVLVLTDWSTTSQMFFDILLVLLGWGFFITFFVKHTHHNPKML